MTAYTIKTEDILVSPYILDENRYRFKQDWNMRNLIKLNATTIPNCKYLLKVDNCFNVPFWRFYADRHNVHLVFEDTDKVLPDYRIIKPTLVCYSGGVESKFTLNSLVNADMLCIDETDSFMPYSMEGSLPFIGAAMGYAVTFIGMEAYTVSKSSIIKDERDDKSLTNIELRDEFKLHLNNYTYPAQHQSIVSLWDRDELVVKTFELGFNPNSCLHQKGGYCGDCYKCWSLYVCLKYHNKVPPFKMTFETAKNYFKELDDYFERGEDKFLSVGTFVKMLDNGFDVRNPNIYDREM